MDITFFEGQSTGKTISLSQDSTFQEARSKLSGFMTTDHQFLVPNIVKRLGKYTTNGLEPLPKDEEADS